MLITIASLILFILPAYVANSVPVLLGGGPPMDFNFRFTDHRRIFGRGKTIRGFVAGIISGILIGGVEAFILPGTAFSFYPNPIHYLLGGLLLGLGTMFGDLAGSFIKRRMGMYPGHPSILLDQLLFFIFALFFVVPLAPKMLTLPNIIFLLLLTFLLHVGANFAANRLGLKKVPW